MNSPVRLLQSYYKSKSNAELVKDIFYDILLTFFFNSGSGFLNSIIKGFVIHFLVESKLPLLIGKRVSITNPSRIKLGKSVRLKNDVTLTAHGYINIGDDTLIGENSIVWSHKRKLSVGSNVTVGKFCYLAQLGGELIIGNNVLIGDYVRMYTKNHRYDDRNKPIKLQGFTDHFIHVENDVWIGSGVTVFNNITIGKGAIIGAHTVVRENVPSKVVYAGNPGKIIKYL